MTGKRPVTVTSRGTRLSQKPYAAALPARHDAHCARLRADMSIFGGVASSTPSSCATGTECVFFRDVGISLRRYLISVNAPRRTGQASRIERAIRRGRSPITLDQIRGNPTARVIITRAVHKVGNPKGQHPAEEFSNPRERLLVNTSRKAGLVISRFADQ